MADVLSTVRKLLGGSDPDFPAPPLAQGEEIVLRGVGARTGGLFGRRWGPLVLTNRRILWYETATVIWPLKRISGEVAIAQIESVDKGSALDTLLGGRRLRLRLRDGRSECLYEGENRLDEWIAAIRKLIVQTAE